jgi:deoxyribodipyrimidine photo-lyase
VYVHDEPGRALGGASRWWLAGALRALDFALTARGGRLHVLSGKAEELIPAVVQAVGARRVVWNRRHEAKGREVDSRLKSSLRAAGIEVASFNGGLLNDPWAITTREGGPMKVYTPYWRNVRAAGDPLAPVAAPETLRFANAGAALPGEVAIDSLRLEPTSPDWAHGLRDEWAPGEAGAAARLAAFLNGGFAGYAEGRNRPDLPSTSKLSPHLRFGEISPRQVWHAAEQAFRSGATRASEADLEVLQKELVWREFSYHLLHHNPDLATRNYSARFDAFPWREDAAALKAWQRGQTGYPIVDAGMRELWHTGWMHNRVRMIVGSFLVKHLLLDWRLGEAWFWDTLVDADPANNAASWQWVAGSGADAAPYFRIFNPVTQGETYDPDGAYVRKWMPELARVPTRYLNKPWEAPRGMLELAGVRLERDYPLPIVDHAMARDRALKAFERTKPNAA